MRAIVSLRIAQAKLFLRAKFQRDFFAYVTESSALHPAQKGVVYSSVQPFSRVLSLCIIDYNLVQRWFTDRGVSRMAHPAHLAILKQGVEVWNRWRKKHPQIKPDLCQAHLTEMDLRQANFRASLLSNVDFTGANLAEANLVGTDLHETVFDEAILSGADLSRADLRATQLYETHLYLATLTRADLRRACLEEAILTCADLTSACLYKANLRRAALNESILHHADFREALLAGANLRRTELVGAQLIHGDLTAADLTEANLTAANFQGALLHGTNFSQAIVDEADLSTARLDATILADVDLSTARGLEGCLHEGPSALDPRTLMKSGSLPLPFLRGCGLPETLIASLPSLLNEPLQRYACFIRYAHHDAGFASRVHDALQRHGVRCWYAPANVQGGKKRYAQREEAIRVDDKVLLVLSEHSMHSAWVKTEIANTRRREVTQQRQILFPMRLVDDETISTWTCVDADTGNDAARAIRAYDIPDFSAWKRHDAFEQAFARLLRALKADDRQTST